MSEGHWPKIKQILNKVLILPPEERLQEAERLCGQDYNLLGEVLSFLGLEEPEKSLFDNPFYQDGILPGTGEPKGSDRLGTDIGPYRVERSLGSGGMGEVYLARRTDNLYQKEVAIKILKPNLGFGEIGKKFRNEGQILANLNHPHIANLLDGGTTENGEPFFIMEYIDGQDLDHFCRRELDLKQRLTLFQKICAAVQHAHDYGIIHRDLKPSNILVTADGEPVLLDFGIAKILDSSHGDPTKTQTQWRFMTPQFASPEQYLGQTVGFRTDVYCLGTLLYIILTGTHPFLEEAESETTTLSERICWHNPQPPSQRLRLKTDPQESTDHFPSQGKLKTLPYKRRLSRDLDRIVLHCLEKNPAERYASAKELSDDIERFLQDRPILAKQKSLWERAKKGMIRHKKLTLPLAVISLFLLALLFWTVTQRAKVDIDRRAVLQAGADAQKELDQAQEVLAFSMSVFDQYDPMVDGSQKVPTKTLIEKIANERNLTILQEPKSRALVYQRLGKIFFHLHLVDRADDLFQESLNIHQNQLNSPPEEQAMVTSDLAFAVLLQGKRKEAEALFEKALALAESKYGEDHPENAPYLSGLAHCRNLQGRMDEAEVLSHKAVALFKPLAELHPEKQADLLQVHAIVLREQRSFPESEQAFLSNIAIKEEILDPWNPSLAHSYSELGYLYRKWGKTDKAAERYVKAFNIFQEKLGSEHPILGVLLGRIAALKRLSGDMEEAEAAYFQAINNMEKAHGKDHMGLASKYNDLGVLYKAWGRYREAIPPLQNSARIIELNGGPDTAVLIYPLNTHGLVHLQLKEPHLAEPIYQRAIEVGSKHYPEEHHRMTQLWGSMCRLKTMRGHYEEAETYGQRAFAQASKFFATNPSNLSWYTNMMGDLKKAQGHIDLAESYYLEVIASYTAQTKIDPVYLGVALQNLAHLYKEQSRLELAEQYSLELIAMMQGKNDIDHEPYRQIVCLLDEIQTP